MVKDDKPLQPLPMPTNPLAGLGKIIGMLGGKKTDVDIKENETDIKVSIHGISQKIAMKHIRNLFDELINEKGD